MIRLRFSPWRIFFSILSLLVIGSGLFVRPAWLALANPHWPVAQTLQPSIVSVSGRQLLVRRRLPDETLGNPEPYVMRGVNWSPAGRATAGTNEARRNEFWNWFGMDIPLLKAMNVNTVRLFLDPGVDSQQGPRGLMVLDELYRNGIMVVMTVDDANRNAARIASVVNYYKQHPALLMWLLGNEWNVIHYDQCNNNCPKVIDIANYIETAASQIKALDANHPIATSYGELGFPSPDATLFEDTSRYVNQVCRSVDVWGLNLYRGNTFGNLFAQWESLSAKPMFLCEFGTDAFFTTQTTPISQGRIEGAVQAHWNFCLWNEIASNLSARDSDKVALGGCLFEWNDEWWKVNPPGSQQTGGYDSANGHPDGRGNEEFFGIVDIDRQTRPAYDLFKIAFNPAYQPMNEIPLRAVSRGAAASEYPTQNGVVRIFKSGAKIFEEAGESGGRGFTVVALNPVNGQLLREIRTFDTWLDRDRNNGQALRDLTVFLNNLPNGTVILIAVADEAGLTQFDNCDLLPFSWTTELLNTLESLGSAKIRNYCYRGSWAMITVKGEGHARQEAISPYDQAVAEFFLKVNHFAYEGDLAPGVNGNGALTVSDWIRAGRLIAGLETVASLGEFQRLDCFPLATSGDGKLTLNDWSQVGRYAAGLEPALLASGPSTPGTSFRTTRSSSRPATPNAKPAPRHYGPSVVEARVKKTGQSSTGEMPKQTVVISLSAQGVENALGFSIGFDARRWQFGNSQIAEGSATASLQINTANANSGKIGVLLALPAGKSFSPGEKALVILQFIGLSDKESPLKLTWEDFPIARTLTDGNAHSLTGDFRRLLHQR